MNQSTQSLLLGLVAIFCWGSVATLGNLLIHLPPFFILGVTFLLGSVPAWRNPRLMFPGWRVSCWGIFGYFIYHFSLFTSFRFAPPIEANLINYQWPMIMVLMSPIFFRSQVLKYYHFIGAALSAIGCVILVTGKGIELKAEYVKGYFFALVAAFSWPLYSLVKKRMGEISIYSIGGFCLGTGVLCLLTHALLEPRVVLQPNDHWLLLLLGLGPFGLAFYAWDLAMGRGDSRVIGALSYLTPVLSTLELVLFANQTLTLSSAVAMVLIIGGASSGLLDFLPSKNLIK